ncbi:phosphotransferase family protein [Kitasatospora sp. NPDC056783]|uniref:phosphotransferase family protein n=1 Tax=Kitasatospora sp. NPDC056783 TaxID=3345943 RepID=UPI0036A0833A
MNTFDAEITVRPKTLDWVNRHLDRGECVVEAEPLRGGMTAEVRRLTIGTGDTVTRHLVLRSFVDSFYLENAEDWLNREAGALTLLAGTSVLAPELVAVDPTAAWCEYPSLLMTHLEGRPVLDDEGIETRAPLLARQLVAIHALRPAERPQRFRTLTMAESVVIPKGGDATVWDAAINVIREPAPPYEGRFLHRDFQPGNVLFDVSPSSPTRARITGVVDWSQPSWGPADLDVAHCCTNLALLHDPSWGLRFAEAYEEAGGVPATAASERLFWLVRDALSCSEEVELWARAYQGAGRTDLTTSILERRLDAYVTSLMNALGSCSWSDAGG